MFENDDDTDLEDSSGTSSEENDADQEVVYAKITAKIQDVTDGTEDGLIEFANRKAGSNVITARLRSDSLQLLNSTGLIIEGEKG